MAISMRKMLPGRFKKVGENGAFARGGVTAWLFTGIGQKSCAQLYSGFGGKSSPFAKYFR
jgi:hypothetical protein